MCVYRCTIIAGFCIQPLAILFVVVDFAHIIMQEERSGDVVIQYYSRCHIIMTTQ